MANNDKKDFNFSCHENVVFNPDLINPSVLGKLPLIWEKIGGVQVNPRAIELIDEMLKKEKENGK